VYQPIVDLVNGKIVGAEALARWKDRDGTQVSPDKFIKVAEENGFIGPLTSLVFRRALSQLHEVLTKIPDFKLDINVTAADLADPAFLPMIDEAMKHSNVQPSSVVIEVTESSTANQEVAMEAIRLLRRRGHGIYIDDFGTGYSSLSYLTYLSVDRIKIDKSFTRAIGTQSPTLAILPPIMAMARSLNLGVVVEGVETEQQALYFTVNDLTVQGSWNSWPPSLTGLRSRASGSLRMRRWALRVPRSYTDPRSRVPGQIRYFTRLDEPSSASADSASSS
jgi:sensor c-di-GMP phosphodiesterase-like protein